ncbi:saccharopine dehydrogenase NADP-binding domain-containing protein [Lysinibacillus sp. NPDC097287]|uniref:saccharopine dehydrogenase NADP-binding domain-containing protein n=1 Tax=Lysinibacillus sp. NPDC097287 TaxID=3364144 RepID=UPI00381D24C1
MENGCIQKKVMVVGASGVLGKLVCIELLRIFDTQLNLIVTDYKEDRGKRFAESLNRDVKFECLDATNEKNVKRVVKNVDIVVVVLKQDTPYIQKACIDNRILCIDVTPFAQFIGKIKLLQQDAEENKVGSIVMSGFFPGLSGLMVHKAITGFQQIDEVNIGLLQNTNAKAGISGILDMLKIISQRVKDDTSNLPGFSIKRKMYFNEPSNEREVRLIDHAEKGYLNQMLNVKTINYWTSWNQPFFNKQISLLKNLGIIEIILKLNNKKFLSKIVKHKPKKDENAYLTVEVKGIIDHKESIRTLFLSTFSDYHTTAMVTAALAKVAVHKKIEGVVYPFEITNIDELFAEINCKEIILKDVIK